MRLVVLGANGRTGKFVLGHALAKNMDVTAVVRSADKAPDLQNENLQVKVGDPCDPVFLASVLHDKDAVISALGGRLPTKAATSVYFRSAASITEAASATGLRRILVTSTALLFPDQTLPGKILRAIVPNVVRSAGRMEDILKTSGLDWTSARPGFLNDTHVATYRAERGSLPEKGTAVSRLALAHFLIDAVDDARTKGAAYGVSQASL
ncbi:NAD(P)-dependent oxidoreductase [uncultured Roseobacter sp.]|uniref:NAD(P)-dependent oxidoreductase n=1 Tax=uncultured Roseobacter sp. TaxID=114847 RepID=UPI0026303E02|nr:NAD(P)-binding oxidoreductase [uncultured Roseobacter sp.]